MLSTSGMTSCRASTCRVSAWNSLKCELRVRTRISDDATRQRCDISTAGPDRLGSGKA